MAIEKKKVTVNIHGLLSSEDCVQMDLPEEEIQEGAQFVYEKVGYKVIRKIEVDVEYPIIYVMVLDIFV